MKSGSGWRDRRMASVKVTVMVIGVAALIVGAAAGGRESATAGPSDKVALLRTPGHGLQPQVVVDGEGILHLIYFSGADGAGDVFYVRSADRGGTFSRSLRV